jgi:hypothetical protein
VCVGVKPPKPGMLGWGPRPKHLWHTLRADPNGRRQQRALGRGRRPRRYTGCMWRSGRGHRCVCGCGTHYIGLEVTGTRMPRMARAPHGTRARRSGASTSRRARRRQIQTRLALFDRRALKKIKPNFKNFEYQSCRAHTGE